METKITGNDNFITIATKMAEGNPGALVVIKELFEKGSEIDPNNILGGGLGTILNLDSYGIYGTDIWVLYSDICEQNLPKFIAVVRSVQLGLFNQEILKDAAHRQDYSGRELIPVNELLEKVKEKLPNFNDTIK
jgi:hypothetical protein